jgi:retinol dehydrogenase 12
MSGPMSYTKTGYSAEQIPDLTGKVAIVTGGNSGIGYETCLELARKNARVFMASRSKERATEAIEKIKAEIGKEVEFIQLDLQDLKQVKSAAEEFLNKGLPLSLLVNNAGSHTTLSTFHFLSESVYLGIMACPFAVTKDGIETQFGTNHVGHFVIVDTQVI